MSEISKDDRWHSCLKQTKAKHNSELEILKFKIKEELWKKREPDHGTRIACDDSSTKTLLSIVDECFDSIEMMRSIKEVSDDS